MIMNKKSPEVGNLSQLQKQMLQDLYDNINELESQEEYLNFVYDAVFIVTEDNGELTLFNYATSLEFHEGDVQGVIEASPNEDEVESIEFIHLAFRDYPQDNDVASKMLRGKYHQLFDKEAPTKGPKDKLMAMLPNTMEELCSLDDTRGYDRDSETYCLHLVLGALEEYSGMSLWDYANPIERKKETVKVIAALNRISTILSEDLLKNI